MTSPLQRYRLCWPSVWLAVLLVVSACDGGIFGTGDGDITILPDGDVVANGSSDTPDGTNTGNSSTVPDDLDFVEAGFDNLLISGDNQSPILNVINVSGTVLSISHGTGTQALITALASGETSQATGLPVSAQSISVFETGLPDNRVTLAPLNLAAFSVTTVIVRNALNVNSANIDPAALLEQLPSSTFELVPLRTLTSAGSSHSALLRIVQANALDEDDSGATFILRPAGSQPGSVDISFTNISAATALQSEYQALGAGDYEMLDSLNRFLPVPLNIESGKVYTLIVTGSQAPVLLIQQDSSIDLSNSASSPD